jgi:hypothetical protein
VAPEAEDPKAKLDPERLGRCESCGASTWVVNEGRYALVEVNDSGPIVTEAGPHAGYALPLYAVVCDSCGNVRLLHANLL